jgi:hypothetical protein
MSRYSDSLALASKMLTTIMVILLVNNYVPSSSFAAAQVPLGDPFGGRLR